MSCDSSGALPEAGARLCITLTAGQNTTRCSTGTKDACYEGLNDLRLQCLLKVTFCCKFGATMCNIVLSYLNCSCLICLLQTAASLYVLPINLLCSAGRIILIAAVTGSKNTTVCQSVHVKTFSVQQKLNHFLVVQRRGHVKHCDSKLIRPEEV